MFNKVWTIDDLKMEKVYAETEGRWSAYRKCFDVNYSSILTKLIQEAGRWCESYASDLFIDWHKVDKFMEDSEFTSAKLVFGFRKMGVDHLEFILSHLNNRNSTEYYRAVWMLEIQTEDGKMTMKLGKVNL